MDLNQITTLDVNNQEEIEAFALSIRQDDIPMLIALLSEKDDKLRYPAYLTAMALSKERGDLYPYWDEFKNKTLSDNSYQRNIGYTLMARNAIWDEKGLMERDIEQYLLCLHDEKPITVRLAVSALSELAPYKKDLLNKVADKLISFDLSSIKETMRKLVLIDILNVLITYREFIDYEEIDSFIASAFTGGILDRKAIKELEEKLK
jgi:hypothetical protein